MWAYNYVDEYGKESTTCIGSREEINSLLIILNTGLWIYPLYSDEELNPQLPVLSRDLNRTYTIEIEPDGYWVSRWEDNTHVHDIYAWIIDRVIEGDFGYLTRKYYSTPGELVVDMFGEPWNPDDIGKEVIDI